MVRGRESAARPFCFVSCFVSSGPALVLFQMSATQTRIKRKDREAWEPRSSCTAYSPNRVAVLNLRPRPCTLWSRSLSAAASHRCGPRLIFVALEQDDFAIAAIDDSNGQDGRNGVDDGLRVAGDETACHMQMQQRIVGDDDPLDRITVDFVQRVRKRSIAKF